MLAIALLSISLGLMAYAAASDLLTMRIPNWLSLALLAAFAAFFVAGGVSWDVALWHLGAAALVLAVCFALFALRWIGGGDAKLAAATALWLGFSSLVDYLLMAALAGGVLTVVILLLRACPMPRFALAWNWFARLHNRKSGVPYGVALALAAVIVFPHSPVWVAAFGA